MCHPWHSALQMFLCVTEVSFPSEGHCSAIGLRNKLPVSPQENGTVTVTDPWSVPLKTTRNFTNLCQTLISAHVHYCPLAAVLSTVSHSDTKGFIGHFWVHQLPATLLLELLPTVPNCKAIRRGSAKKATNHHVMLPPSASRFPGTSPSFQHPQRGTPGLRAGRRGLPVSKGHAPFAERASAHFLTWETTEISELASTGLDWGKRCRLFSDIFISPQLYEGWFKWTITLLG